jgi:hypothetical protein
VDPITITGVTAGQVRDWLARVLPHLGDDDTLPFLMRVQITIGEGYLLAAATDRYTLAVAHLPAATGAARARFTIDGERARDMAAELGYHRNLTDVPAVLALADDRFSIDLHGYHDEDREPYFDGEWNTTPVESDPEFIKWEALVRPLLAEPADPAPVQVRADLLARFTTPGTLTLDPASPTVLTAVSLGGGPLPLVVHSPGRHRALVLLGPGFLGLLAVLKTRTEHPAPATPDIDPDPWRTTWGDLLSASPALARA